MAAISMQDESVDATATRGANGKPAALSSVDKALRLLEVLGREELVSVSRAAQELGVARSTAHRLLTVLQAHEFAYQDPSSKAYGAGTALLRAGLGAVDSLELRTVARPEIERLSNELGETVHLIIRDGARTFVLDSIESREALRVSSRLGGSMPCHTTGAGKVLLSQLSEHEVRELLGPEPLAARTANTITTYAALGAELDCIRERGFAVNNAENEPNILAVAALIDSPARPAAVSAAAPAARVDEERLQTIAAQTIECTRRIGERPRAQL